MPTTNSSRRNCRLRSRNNSNISSNSNTARSSSNISSSTSNMARNSNTISSRSSRTTISPTMPTMRRAVPTTLSRPVTGILCIISCVRMFSMTTEQFEREYVYTEKSIPI